MIDPNYYTKESLYQLAGKCFAAFLGFPDIDRLLEKSTYFYVDLTDESVLFLHPESKLLSMTDVSAIKHYSQILELMTQCLDAPCVSEIGDSLTAKSLIEEYRIGNRFRQFLFSCKFGGIPSKKQICCDLEEADGRIFGLFLICDVTDVHDTDIKLLRRVEFDGLTNLYNRNAGDLLVLEYLKNYPQDSAAVVMLDIDHFKRFNDQYGHEVGDVVLRGTARHLEQHFGRDSVIIRNGGDEFLVLLKHRTEAEALDEVRNFSNASYSIQYQEHTYHCTYSVGFAMYPEQGREYHDLAMKADVAMYTVKMHHRNSYLQYRPDLLLQKRTQLSFQLADIVSGIPGAILVYKADEKEEILFANQQLYDLFECDSMEELLSFSGDSFKNIVHPDDLDAVEESIKKQIAANPFGLDYVSYRIITKSGKVKMIDDIGHLVHTPKYGDIFYVFLYDREQKADILRLAGLQE
ncbi:MAG: diguanylate cyclase [Oscillospiraceae bacterium]|nr:diguanylate cyclase [Oscillospiraceae bacterium]